MPSNNLALTVFQRMNRHKSMAVLFRKPAEQQAVVLARYPSPEGFAANQEAQVVEDETFAVTQNSEITQGDRILRADAPQFVQPNVPPAAALWQPEQMQPYSNLQQSKPGETSHKLQRQILAKQSIATVGVRPESELSGSQVAATAQNNEQSVVPKVQRETTQRTETESNVASSASAITDSEKTPLWMQSISRAMHLHDAKQNSEETVPENTPALATRSATPPRMESDVNSDAQEKQMAEPSASTRRATIIEAPLNASARQQKSEEHLSTATAPQQSSVQRVTAQPSQISPATQSVLQQATSDKSTGTKASDATANVQPSKAYTNGVSVAQPSVSLANATDAAQFVEEVTQNQTNVGEPPSTYPAEAENYLPSPLSQNDESQSQVSDEMDSRMPLESAWPVQRTSLPVPDTVGNRSDAGEVDFSGTTSKAQERIHKVAIQSEMPTDSLIDVVTPRRPPPRRSQIVQSQIVQPQQVEEAHSGQSPNLHTPENATIQRKAQDGIAAATVSTQPLVSNPGTTSKGSVDAFAGFPEDLWHLIGETAPNRQPIQASPVESPAEPFSQTSGQPVSSTLQMQTNSSNQQHENFSDRLQPDELATASVSAHKEVAMQPLPDNAPLHSAEETTNRAANEANEALTNRASGPQVMRAIDSVKATNAKSMASETRQQAQTTTYSAAASNVVPVSSEVQEGVAQEQTLQVVDTQEQTPLRSSAITQADSVLTSKSPIESTDSMVSMKPLPQPALPQPASSASPEIRPETSKNSSPIEDEKGVKPKSTTARESVDEVIQRMEQQHSQQHSTPQSRDNKPQPTGGQTIQSIQPATPAIQRANEPVGGQEQSQNGGATDEKKTEKAKLSDADKDELVRQVYTKLKRKLAVERERVR